MYAWIDFLLKTQENRHFGLVSNVPVRYSSLLAQCVSERDCFSARDGVGMEIRWTLSINCQYLEWNRIMMTKKRFPQMLCIFMLALTTVVAVSGCRTVMTTAAYLILGTDQPAEYDGLKEKRVVVYCQGISAVKNVVPNVDSEIAQQLSRLLKANVKECDVVDYAEVADWLDNLENQWQDPVEIGEAFKADYVVAIELTKFQLHEGQTLLRGQAEGLVQVVDCSAEKYADVPFERELKVVYPPNVPFDTAQKDEREFKKQFVDVVADHFGRYFYPHDGYSDYAVDSYAHQPR